MNLDINDTDPGFRKDVREFLEASLPADIANAPHAIEPLDPRVQRKWYDILAERGWTMPAWPEQYGGTGWSHEKLHIFDEELGAAGAPAQHGFAKLVGPVIYTYGTEEQKAQHLPGLISGATPWCQGFSEPESGSDLASLKTRAIRDGDDYVVNGSKIWTTFGHRAEWMFCLVRTSTEGKPQTGISFLLLDMKTPGISIRPITSIDGLHHLNQVFFDNVRVPVANRIGEENKGWDYAKFLLEIERFSAAPVGPLKARLKQVRRLASEGGEGDLRLIDDPAFRHKLAKAEIDVLAMEALSLRQLVDDDALLAQGGASMLKLVGTQLQQAVAELAVEATGVYGQTDQAERLLPGSNEEIVGPAEGPDAVVTYLIGRAATIYGGTSEIQRNIIARMMNRG